MPWFSSSPESLTRYWIQKPQHVTRSSGATHESSQAVRNHSFGSLKLSARRRGSSCAGAPGNTHFFMLFAIVMYLVYGGVVLGIKP